MPEAAQHEALGDQRQQARWPPLAFAGADLVATGSSFSEGSAAGDRGQGSGKSVQVRWRRNLWSLGATVGDAGLLRFAAAGSEVSGEKTLIPEDQSKLYCGLALTSIAFDPSGALWATNLSARSGPFCVSAWSLSASPDLRQRRKTSPSKRKAPRNFVLDKDGNMGLDRPACVSYPAASLAAGHSCFRLRAQGQNRCCWSSRFRQMRSRSTRTAISGDELRGERFSTTPRIFTPTVRREGVVPPSRSRSQLARCSKASHSTRAGPLVHVQPGKVARLAPEQLGDELRAQVSRRSRLTIVTSADIGYAGVARLLQRPPQPLAASTAVSEELGRATKATCVCSVEHLAMTVQLNRNNDRVRTRLRRALHASSPRFSDCSPAFAVLVPS